MSMEHGGFDSGYRGISRDAETRMAPAEGSTGSQFSRSRASTLLPLLATGLSAWWLISTLRGTSPVPRRVRRAASNLGHRASSMAAPLGRKTGRVASRVKEKASEVRDRAGAVAQGLHQKTSHVKGSVSSKTGHARSELDRLVQDEPLMACGAAVLLGAAVGALIPETPPEHRMMGPARDSLLQKGREAVGQAAERVRSHSKPGGATDALLQAMGLVQGARMRHEGTEMAGAGTATYGEGAEQAGFGGPDLASQAGAESSQATSFPETGEDMRAAGTWEHEPTAQEIMQEGHVDVGASTEFGPDEPLPRRAIHDEAMPSPAEEGNPLFRHTEPREDLMRREIGEDPHF